MYNIFSKNDYVSFIGAADDFFKANGKNDIISKSLSQKIEQYIIQYYFEKIEYSLCAGYIEKFILKYTMNEDRQYLLALYSQLTNCYLGLNDYTNADRVNSVLITSDPDNLKYYLTEGFILGETIGKQEAYRYLATLTSKFKDNEKLLAFMTSYKNP